MPPANKIQRWIDLLAALLGRHAPVTFEEIALDVPAYTGKAKDSTKRMFERDKRELKALGIPIESEGEEGEKDFRYRLRTKDFYLPYIATITSRGRTRPLRVDRYGYHSLRSLTFDADELRAVADGAARVSQLGNASLAADASSAMRKLAFDLPVGAVTSGGGTMIVPTTAAADPKVLQELADALHARKRVSFQYHAQGANITNTRTVEPYGLFFLTGHWYLAARDTAKDALRNFRVSRIEDAAQCSPTRELPEYDVPANFHLRDHARSKQAWELGDSEVVDAIVELRGDSGAAHAAAALGMPVEIRADRRHFLVRQRNAFVRWLLSFSGEIVPISPPELCDEFHRVVAATLAAYETSERRDIATPTR